MTTDITTGWLGLRHVALFVTQFEACIDFYTRVLPMTIEWQPDADNCYLTSGTDNLALHRAKSDSPFPSHQRLDHFGFVLATKAAVDQWHAHCAAKTTAAISPPKQHRDGAYSFYLADPDGNSIQMIYHPPISDP